MLRLNLLRNSANKSICSVSSSSIFLSKKTNSKTLFSCPVSALLATSHRFASGSRASFGRPASVPSTSPATSASTVSDDIPRKQQQEELKVKEESTINKSDENKNEVTSNNNNNDNNKSPEKQQHPKPDEPLWPNCDTIEEIIEEEKFGPEGEEDKQPPVEPEHVVLAFRAFVWGTFWAFVGVGTISLIAMKMGGFTSVKDVLAYVGDKDKRRLEEMKAQGVEVIEYNVDLTNPSSVPDQLTQVWNHILTTSGAAAEIEQAMEEAAKESEKEEKEKEEKAKEDNKSA